MRIRTFSFLSISSLAFAVITNLVAKARFSDAAIGVATASDSDRMLSTMLKRVLNEGQVFEKISYCFVVLGVVLWITSAIRRERNYQAVLFVLMFVFLFLEFLFV